MKKTLLFFALVLCIGLSACGGSEPPKKENEKTETPKDASKEKEKSDTPKKEETKKEETKGPDKPVEKSVDDDVSEK